MPIPAFITGRNPVMWGGIGPPEDSIMTNATNLTRRKLLASLPAAAAMAPAAATALCRLPSGDDAELLALGREMAPLVAEITAARAIDRVNDEDFKAKLVALGLKPEKEYEDIDAYRAERSRLCDEIFASDDYKSYPGHRDWEDLHDDLFELLDEVLAIRPTTIQGLAVQVLAIVTAYDDLCEEESDDGEFPHGVTTFFRNVCEFTGVPIPAA
jgi:hypothetical protein